MNFKQKIPAQVLKLSEHVNVRIAGGAVRDLIMGKTPKDYDLATPFLPENVMKAATTAGFDVIPTGLKHGTVTVVVDSMPLEVTTLRVDKETDGRHAEVEYGVSWRNDASRRDLTINSLFLDMEGEVHDYFHGVDDIKTRTIRFVGDPDERIQQDYLRLLRAYRFCGQLGKETCPESFLHPARRNAHGLAKISGERIWSEMKLILTSDMPWVLLHAMKDAGVLPHIGLGEHLDLERLEGVCAFTRSPITRLVGVTPTWHPSTGGPELIKTLKSRWKLSGPEMKLARFLVDAREWVPAGSARSKYRELVILNDIDKRWVEELAALQVQPFVLGDLQGWEPPVFPINGKDLIELGMDQGPSIGIALGHLKSVWFRSGFRRTREDLLEYEKARIALVKEALRETP